MDSWESPYLELLWKVIGSGVNSFYTQCDLDHPSWIIYLVRYCENALHCKPSKLPLCLDANTTSIYTLAAANWTKPAAPQSDCGGKVLFNILPLAVPQHKDYTQPPRP